jgi:hypothetical protein
MVETDMEMDGTDVEVQPPTSTQTQGGSSCSKKFKCKTTPVLNRAPKQSIVRKKLPPRKKFSVVFKPLDNWERWQQMADDEWAKTVRLGSFYNWS